MSPSPLTPAEYLGHIRTESARFHEAVRQADPGASVPTCPDWTAKDLLWHLGAQVQQFWAYVVEHRPETPDSYEEPEQPTGYDEVDQSFVDASYALVHALENAHPDDKAWSWTTDPALHNVAWVLRRQAHEALIHRLDAELTAGLPFAPISPELAADGVDEVLDVMYGGLPTWGRFEPGPDYAEFRLTDVDRSVWTQLGTFSGTTPEGEVRADELDMHVVDAPDVPAAAVFTATAADMDAWLWHRCDDAAIAITGDDHALADVRKILGQAID